MNMLIFNSSFDRPDRVGCDKSFVNRWGHWRGRTRHSTPLLLPHRCLLLDLFLFRWITLSDINFVFRYAPNRFVPLQICSRRNFVYLEFGFRSMKIQPFDDAVRLQKRINPPYQVKPTLTWGSNPLRMSVWIAASRGSIPLWPSVWIASCCGSIPLISHCAYCRLSWIAVTWLSVWIASHCGIILLIDNFNGFEFCRKMPFRSSESSPLGFL